MQNKFNRITWAVAIAAAAFASQANAGGYQINEQSVSGQGYGHAGRSSNVNDATIVFGNPAGMSFLDRAQLTAGGTYLNVNSRIRNARSDSSIDGAAAGLPVAPGDVQVPLGPIDGTNDGDMVPGTLIPFAFYAHPVNERLAFGFGVYAPFGSKTEYEDTFEGRNFGNYTEVRVISAQPTVSYRFNDQWSVGVGVTYNRVDGELATRIPGTLLGRPGGPDGEVRVEGDDEAYGYNIGVMYQPVPETTFGLTYRSKVSYTLEGSSRASGGAEALIPNQNASLELTTPETVNFSVTQQMSDRLKLMLGASWARWSRFEEIRIDGSLNPDPITQETQNYSNAWAFGVGGEYQLNRQLALRAGVTIDNTPTSDEFRSVRIPSDDRRIFSIGAGWSPTEDITLDFAYSYLTERGTTIDRQRTLGPMELDYAADYKNEAHGFGAQLTYRF
ncbi:MULTISPECIES: OmpP1/FadL family transporter [unclassified Halomonas]|uniref:OmpP1/FadL family transporter n=1 Tax=unclassified Halomonas TaxID=2609666 RepID=UPI000287B20B|nr:MULTISPECIES: outer membrane protein transport protein [unclassified Halomonas]MCE8038033.1 outer membrane beta-barrel protein [Halomonas sp. MCCC 1A11062]